MAPLLTLVLLALPLCAARAATTVRVVNPFDGAIINTNVSPQVYLVNGTCHKADAVSISINDGPESFATIKGAAWEWLWDLSTVVPSDNVKVVAKPYLAGVAGTPQTLFVKVRAALPGGSIDVLPSSVIAGLYAGKGAVLGDPSQPYVVAVLVRGDAGPGKVIDEIKLSSPTSVDQVYTPATLEKFNVQTAGASAIPALFVLGNDPLGPGLRERIEAIGVTYGSSPGGLKSNIFQRRIIVDPTPPVRKQAVSAAFPRKNIVALTGAFADATSGIESVVVEITPPGGGTTVVVPATLTFGNDYANDVTWYVEYETALEGVMNVVVKARDNAGNERRDPDVGTFAVTTDRTGPVPTFTAPAPSAFVSGSSVAIAGTIADAGSTTWKLYDNGSLVTQGAGPTVGHAWNTTLVEDGVHTLTLVAADAQHNESETSVAVTVDNTAPTVDFLKPVDGDFVSDIVQIHGAVTECNLDNWQVLIDTGGGFVDPPIATGTTTSVTALWDTTAIPANTTCTIKILATDKAGLNNAATADTIQVKVVKAGSVTITDPADGAFVRGTHKIKFTIAVDAVTGWELHDLDSVPSKLTDGAANGSFDFDWDTTGKDGRHTLKLTAKNALGVTVDTSAIVTVDNTPPVVAVTSPAPGAFVRGTQPINATITDVNPDKYQINLDGTMLTPPGIQPGSTVAFAWNTVAVADGSHTIKVLAVDKALNDNAAAADSVTVTVDNTAPTATITSPADGAVVTGAMTVTGTFVEANLQKWELFDNGVLFATDTTPSPATAAWNPVGDGPHVLRLVVTDLAGNSGTASVTVVVDTAPPVLSLNVAPTIVAGATTFVKGEIKITGTIADANLQNWTLTDTGDAGFVRNGNAPNFSFTYNTVGHDGTHKFVLNAVDTGGNASSADVTVVADNTKPVVVITAPSDGSFVKGTISLTGTVTDANLQDWQWLDNGRPVPGGSGVGSTASASLNTTLSPDGAHTITLVGRDLAGNVEDTVRVTVTVDNTPPSVTIDALPKVQDGADFFVEKTIRVVGTVVEANLLNYVLTDDNDPALNVTGNQPGGVSAPYTTTGEGSHTFRLKATDKVGFTAEQTVKVLADNVAPSAVLNNPTPSVTIGSRVFVKGQINITGTVA
ncbi:MAG: hypothetical protein GX446_13040, partial [Chthonomonadales bacterium]|nr:hypothetical protein [Chthonomonadales bacterium]